MSAGERRVPWDDQAEQAVLGAMMLNPDAALDATDHLTADDFHSPANAAIYDAIHTITSDGQRCDLVTLHAHLTRTGQLEAVGGHQKLLAIQTNTPATGGAVVARWAGIVAAHATHRRIIAASDTIAELGYTGTDPATSLDAAEQALQQVSDRRHGDPTHLAIAATIDAHIDALEQARHDPDSAGVRTGFHDLDTLIGGGLRPGQLIIVAGRPAMGKSIMSAQVALNAADHGHPGCIVSLEMGRDELTDRLLANVANTDLHLIRSRRYGDIDLRRLAAAAGNLRGTPLDIDDNAAATLLAVRAAARRTARNHGRCDVLIVDYLQLMSSPTGGAGRRPENRQVEIADISRGLKLIARDLQVPVVALSQLNRSVELRADKRPMLSDLRESGAIENDADIVIALYRDDYYHPDSKHRGTVEAIVLKQRMGPTGMVRLGFLGATQRLTNLTGAGEWDAA